MWLRHRSARGCIEPKFHSGRLEVSDGSVGEVLPPRDFSRDVVRNAANREIRICIGDCDGDIARLIEFPGTQRGTDSRITPTDDDEVHRSP